MIKEIIAHCMHYAGNIENFLTSIKKNILIGKKNIYQGLIAYHL